MFMLYFRIVLYSLLFCISLGVSFITYGAQLNEPAQITEEKLLFEEIPSVFGASKYEQKVTEAPSSVTILTSEDIQKYGYRTLGEALLSVRGFYQSHDRMVAKVAVRGFGLPGDTNTRLLLLLDGQRTNDNIFESGSISSFDTVDVDLVDRVEVIRGPGSSLYGTNAVLSVINIITKRGRDIEGTEFATEVGSQERYTGRLTYGSRRPSGLEALFTVKYMTGNGEDSLYYEEFDSPPISNGVVEDLDGLKNFTLFTKISYQDFTLEGFYLNRLKEIPTAPYGVVFGQSGTEAEGITGFLNLEYKHLFPNQVEFEANLSHNSYEENGDYVYGGPVINRDEFRGSWWGADFQASKQFERHRVIVGGEFRDNYRQDQKNYDLGGPTYLTTEESSRSLGAYVQEEYRVSEEVILNLGVRYDYYDSFGGTINPRAGLIYNPVENTTLKFLYGRAFRAPNAFERFYSDGGVSWKPNPDLDPEIIDTYEVVWEQNLWSKWRGVATAFYYQIEDLINLTLDPGDGLVVYQNIGEVEARGFELELEGPIKGSLVGKVSYSYQLVEDQLTGERIPNSPEHLIKVNLSLPVYQNMVFLSIEEQYMSERRTTSGNTTGGYAVTNISLLAKDIKPGLQLSASVYNLFDEEFSDPASQAFLQDDIEQDGITVNFKLTYRF